jgi:hypothetical protein
VDPVTLGGMSGAVSTFRAACAIRKEERVLVAAHSEQRAMAGKVLIVPRLEIDRHGGAKTRLAACWPGWPMLKFPGFRLVDQVPRGQMNYWNKC